MPRSHRRRPVPRAASPRQRVTLKACDLSRAASPRQQTGVSRAASPRPSIGLSRAASPRRKLKPGAVEVAFTEPSPLGIVWSVNRQPDGRQTLELVDIKRGSAASKHMRKEMVAGLELTHVGGESIAALTAADRTQEILQKITDCPRPMTLTLEPGDDASALKRLLSPVSHISTVGVSRAASPRPSIGVSRAASPRSRTGVSHAASPPSSPPCDPTSTGASRAASPRRGNWEWQDDSGTWRRYSPILLRVLEEQFAAGSTCAALPGVHRWHVDFATMLQHNTATTGAVRRVRRVEPSVRSSPTQQSRSRSPSGTRTSPPTRRGGRVGSPRVAARSPMARRPAAERRTAWHSTDLDSRPTSPRKPHHAARADAFGRFAPRWCTKGAFAKQRAPSSKVGEVLMDPDSDAEVKVRWSDGTESGYIKAAELLEADYADQQRAADQQKAARKQAVADRGRSADSQRSGRGQSQSRSASPSPRSSPVRGPARPAPVRKRQERKAGSGVVLKEYAQGGGQTVREYADGRREVIFPTGQRKITHADGKEESVFPGGQKQITHADGTQVTIFEDDGRVRKDGSYTANEKTEFPDGRVKILWSNGNVDVTYPARLGGHKETVLPSGEKQITYRDGTTDVVTATGMHIPATLEPSRSECSGDYQDCDARALAARSGQHWQSVQQLAEHLVEPFRGQIEKMARVMFRWVSNNIAYDVDRYRAGNITHASCEADYVMRHALAVCSGYANLLCAMCDAVGVHCKKISGSAATKADTYRSTDQSNGHAWNALSFDRGRTWHLCDPCWAAGGTGARTFTRRFDKVWWCTSPEHFIEGHLPEQASDQMLDVPLTTQQWLRLRFTAWAPTTFSSMNDGDEVLSPSNGTLQSGQSVTFKLFLNERSASTLRLQWFGEWGATMRSERVSGGYVHSISARVPRGQSGKVKVFKEEGTRATSSGSSTHYSGLCEWTINYG